MSDLRLVGLSDDGSRLVLEVSGAADGGDQFFLPVDERIHAALRGDRARLGQLQIELESKLRPREIQARIRSGQSLDEVARDAGIPIDRVLRYASPVLHEREYIAQEAAKAGVKRDDQGAVMLLGELVAERLEERGIPREGIEWDAWRRDDGGWEVRLDYMAGDTQRSALWLYDPIRRTVTADDDDARWLLEEKPAASVTQLRALSRHKGSKAGEHPVPAEEETTPANYDDAPDTSELSAPKSAAAKITNTPAPQPTPRENAIAAATRGQRRTVPDTPPSKKKRASVPSWDEILFGSRKPE
ncbi:MAG TPA: septation protein SepH [Actinomycetes bacterium]|nr:septation protein SepH [Actinomycetes bacterium]